MSLLTLQKCERQILHLLKLAILHFVLNSCEGLLALTPAGWPSNLANILHFCRDHVHAAAQAYFGIGPANTRCLRLPWGLQILIRVTPGEAQKWPLTTAVVYKDRNTTAGRHGDSTTANCDECTRLTKVYLIFPQFACDCTQAVIVEFFL